MSNENGNENGIPTLKKKGVFSRFFSLVWKCLKFFSKRLYNRWNDDSVFFSAAAIAFNVLVTIIPLGLLILTFSGLAYEESGSLQSGLQSWLETANPLIPESILDEVETIIFAGKTGIPGIIGFVFLLWLVSRLFGTIRTAFDRIFEVPKGRNIVLGKLYDFFLALLIAVCFTSAIFFSTMAKLVIDSTPEAVFEVVSGWPIIGAVTGKGMAGFLGLVFTVLLFFTLFWAAPNKKMTKSQALVATIITTVFTWLGSMAYIAVVSNANWGIVYGSMAMLMATFFLLYWECVILLGAAEVSQVIVEWRTIRRTLKTNLTEIESDNS